VIVLYALRVFKVGASFCDVLAAEVVCGDAAAVFVALLSAGGMGDGDRLVSPLVVLSIMTISII
jgi:hypothetical protein